MGGAFRTRAAAGAAVRTLIFEVNQTTARKIRLPMRAVTRRDENCCSPREVSDGGLGKFTPAEGIQRLLIAPHTAAVRWVSSV
jgi:hypothetical protein